MLKMVTIIGYLVSPAPRSAPAILKLDTHQRQAATDDVNKRHH